MRTETTTRTIYRFSELDEEARSRVVERDREQRSYCWQTEEQKYYTDQFFEDHLDSFGVDYGSYEPTVDLSFCQGSGASFTGIVDVRDFIRAKGLYNKFRRLYVAQLKAEREGYSLVNFEISRSRYAGNYYHEYTTDVEITVNPHSFYPIDETYLFDVLDNEAVQLEKIAQEWLVEMNKALYKECEQAYWADTDEDYIIELLMDYDDEYNEDGERA